MRLAWADCSECLREARHELEADRRTCLACGAVSCRGGTEGGNGGGITGGAAFTAPTSSPTSSAQSPSSTTVALPDSLTAAWTVAAETLRQFDRLASFAEFVLDRAGLRLELDVHQVLEVEGSRVAVSVWLDRRGLFVVRVEDGWTGPNRARRSTPPETLSLAEIYAVAHSRRLFLPAKGEYRKAEFGFPEKAHLWLLSDVSRRRPS
jgi:hypothetical protein